MRAGDEARVNRARLAEAGDDVSRAPGPEPYGVAVFAGTTTTKDAAYPTTARSWYAVLPARQTGPAVEGGPVNLTAVGATPVLAANVGESVPPVGTPVEVVRFGGNYIFCY
jgi:hypothetical protein